MKNKGFSLVELIVVIAIMAILVGVAVPVYTSYIGKANAAKDEQLLGEINSAFMVAAVAEGVTDFTFKGTDTPDIPVLDDGTVDLANMKPETLKAAMIEILGTDLKFSVIEDIWYNSATRQFEDNVVTEYQFGEGVVKLSAEDIEKLKSSNFASLGMNTLMGKVNAAVGVVSSVDSTSSLYALVYAEATDENPYGYSDLTKKTIANLLGFEEWDNENEDLAEAFGALLLEKTGGDETKLADAAKEIAANAAVLSAATNSDIDTDAFSQSLANGTAISEIKSAGTEEQLGQIAMAYAMYTSFVTEYNKTADEEDKKEVSTDVGTVLTTIKSDADFKAYMNTTQASTDMEGYLAAMNMINASSSDSKAVSKLLVNGFTDEDLEKLLNDAIGE